MFQRSYITSLIRILSQKSLSNSLHKPEILAKGISSKVPLCKCNFNENIVTNKPNYRNASSYLDEQTAVNTSVAPKKNWVTVTYVKANGERITARGREGDTFLDVAVNNSLDLPGFGLCEGTLCCSTCHLIFKKEDYDRIQDPQTEEELDMMELSYECTDTPDVKCISFAGCGFLSLYLIGAASCLQRHSPHVFEKTFLCGASAGALLAACLACRVPLETIKQSVFSTAADAQLWAMGPFSPSFNTEDYLRQGLSHLPEDAHLIASNRVFVSLTRTRDLRNVIVSSWDSREELIQSLLCSCFIPMFSGTKFPKFRGETYMDGGFTDNLPIAANPHLSISPFAGKSDICPVDHYKHPRYARVGNHVVAITPKNVARFMRALFPLPLEALENLYEEGFLQTKLFLQNYSFPKP